MQNANLLNLPENYTFKYCACRVSSAREGRSARMPAYRMEMLAGGSAIPCGWSGRGRVACCRDDMQAARAETQRQVGTSSIRLPINIASRSRALVLLCPALLSFGQLSLISTS